MFCSVNPKNSKLCLLLTVVSVILLIAGFTVFLIRLYDRYRQNCCCEFEDWESCDCNEPEKCPENCESQG